MISKEQLDMVETALAALKIEAKPEVMRAVCSLTDDWSKVLAGAVVVGLVEGIRVRFDRIVEALEAIPTELKEQTLEIELQSGWIKSISDAVREHIVELGHTQR